MLAKVKKPRGLSTPGEQMLQRRAELLAELEIPKVNKPKPVKAAAEGGLLAT